MFPSHDPDKSTKVLISLDEIAAVVNLEPLDFKLGEAKVALSFRNSDHAGYILESYDQIKKKLQEISKWNAQQ